MGRDRTVPARVIFIVGPTASGKSDVAVCVARALRGEIICCDSMQVYRGMRIISSAPTAEQQRSVKHRLVGVISPRSAFDVSHYRRRALAALGSVVRRGKTPLFVGGSGMYMSVLLDGIFTGPAADPAIRRRLTAYAARYGCLRLHKRLARIDPAAARKIHPNDTRRVIRALEVFELSGTPISVLQQRRAGLSADHDVRIFCISRSRADLYGRIDARVEAMLSAGLLNEVRRLRARGLGPTARWAIGLQEFAGGLASDEAVKLMKRNTRRYAKRQLTWFRKDKRIEWVRVRPGETAAGVARRILVNLRKMKPRLARDGRR